MSPGTQQRAAYEQAIAALDRSGHVFHKHPGDSYASGSNRGAIRHARHVHGVVGIDLDFNPNAEQHPWVHHQLHPTKRDAWFDPRHKIGDQHSCRELSDAQMGRLRVHAHGRNWAMLDAYDAAEECARQGLIPCFEAKFTSPLYLDPQWWHDQFIDGWPPRFQPVIMSLPGTRGGRTGLDKLAAAHEVGLPTMWLWRGQPPAGYSRHVDLVKSRPHRGIYRLG